jgi:primary-amine oxidase
MQPLLSGGLPTMGRLELLDGWRRGRRVRLSTAGWILALPILLGPVRSDAPASTVYALDPLSRDELVATRAVLSKSGKIHPTTRIATITLHEPAKDGILASLHGGQSVPRAASVMLYDWSTGIAGAGIVNLQRDEIVSWTDRPPADPPILYLTVARATEVAKADPRFRSAMARRGYSDLSRLRVEPAIASDYVLPQRNGERVAPGVVFDQDALDMGSSRQLGAVTVWENLTRGTLDSMRDTADAKTLDSRPSAPVARPVGLAPPTDRSTAGAAHIDIRGTAVRWGRWRLRAAFDPRRGLELYDIGFVDQGAVRSILYRASISEMIAPYGDPGFGSWFPMDEGDVGLGIFGMTSAVPGEDAPANATFLPAVFANDQGQLVEIPRAVAVFERETGVEWRHARAAGHARELVVRGYCTADNYDYVFDWIFREDGSIQVQVALTGIVNSNHVPDQHEPAVAGANRPILNHLVAAGIRAPIHQHFFSYRLDFDIDRPDHNRVMELTASGLPAGPGNVGGEWFAAQTRTLRTEHDAVQDPPAASWRQWRVISTRDTNALGQPTGYALLPGDNTVPYPSATSAPRRRAGFVAHELWVTPYNPDEMYAAGEVPSRDTSLQGLVRWTAADRPIDERDVVLWYTMGVTHLPRTEDWPVMPAYTVGFRLVPAGFFSHDPALDTVPVSTQ